MDDTAWRQLSAKQREAVVHQRVFGHDLAAEKQHWRPGDAHSHIPHYSRDIRSAWLIVDRLYQLAPSPQNTPLCHVHLLGDGRVWTVEVDVGNGRMGEATSESVCEALCLATLRLLSPAREAPL